MERQKSFRDSAARKIVKINGCISKRAGKIYHLIHPDSAQEFFNCASLSHGTLKTHDFNQYSFQVWLVSIKVDNKFDLLTCCKVGHWSLQTTHNTQRNMERKWGEMNVWNGKSNNWPGMVVHVCNPSYAGGIVRRIWGWPQVKTLKTLSEKQLKQNRAWDVTQLSSTYLSSVRPWVQTLVPPRKNRRKEN
jgi:hypothetical protein